MDKLVRWREFYSEFGRLYPRTIQEVTDTEAPAWVNYCGIPFQIRPPAAPAAEAFEVWGLPFVNIFPDPQIENQLERATA